MYQKVHMRLTLLCAGITAVIMIVMSLCYLYVSETGLYNNQFQSFRNDINTITTNLEQSSVISMEWLSKMETQGNYLFFVFDNGIPFLYNQLDTSKAHSSKETLLEESLAACYSLSAAVPSSADSSSYTSDHFEYEFTSASTNTGYFAGIVSINGKSASSLEVVVLSSLEALEQQIREQRLRFILIDLAAILLLTVFSWIFTGKLLVPIEESQQKQAQFTAAASHELRTPLAVILSATECCKTAAPDKQAHFLKIIRQEGLRVSALVNDMLTLSQSDSHRLAVRPRPTELDTLLMNVYETFEPLAREKEISLSLQLPKESLPLCSADPDRINQVLAVLIHNAVSYTPTHGHITLTLSCERIHGRDAFRLSVTDDGIGVPDADKARIFDRFYRAEKSRSDKEHFGLGLSIAYEIVKAHGGSITVADAQGGGSAFTVIL